MVYEAAEKDNGASPPRVHGVHSPSAPLVPDMRCTDLRMSLKSRTALIERWTDEDKPANLLGTIGIGVTVSTVGHLLGQGIPGIGQGHGGLLRAGRAPPGDRASGERRSLGCRCGRSLQRRRVADRQGEREGGTRLRRAADVAHVSGGPELDLTVRRAGPAGSSLRDRRGHHRVDREDPRRAGGGRTRAGVRGRQLRTRLPGRSLRDDVRRDGADRVRSTAPTCCCSPPPAPAGSTRPWSQPPSCSPGATWPQRVFSTGGRRRSSQYRPWHWDVRSSDC